MLYITHIVFPQPGKELDLRFGSEYPYPVFLRTELKEIEFAPVTILYGNNGSGKSTVLKLIAEKTNARQNAACCPSDCFFDFAALCDVRMQKAPETAEMITSDDVFDYMLNIRAINSGIDEKREELCKQYLEAKYARFRLGSIADYERMKEINETRKRTQSKYIKDRLIRQTDEWSNGETAYGYFVEKIGENGLYLLDEPENSLSPKRQIELKASIEDAARFFGCQFVLSTHSPFLLALRGAKIYDLDAQPAAVKKWTELENVRLYRDLFEENKDAF